MQSNRQLEGNFDGGDLDHSDKESRFCDPLGWIARVESSEVHDTIKEGATRVHHYEQDGGSLLSVLEQEDARSDVGRVVGSSDSGVRQKSLRNLYERLTTLCQTSFVDDYVQQFESQVAQASVVTDEQLLGFFFCFFFCGGGEVCELKSGAK